MTNDKYDTYPANVLVRGLGSTEPKVFVTAGMKSCKPREAKFVVPKALAKISSVHLISFSAVVACH